MLTLMDRAARLVFGKQTKSYRQKAFDEQFVVAAKYARQLDEDENRRGCASPVSHIEHLYQIGRWFDRTMMGSWESYEWAVSKQSRQMLDELCRRQRAYFQMDVRTRGNIVVDAKKDFDGLMEIMENAIRRNTKKRTVEVTKKQKEAHDTFIKCGMDYTKAGEILGKSRQAIYALDKKYEENKRTQRVRKGDL